MTFYKSIQPGLILTALFLLTANTSRAEEAGDSLSGRNEIVYEVNFTGGGSTGTFAPYLLGSNSMGRHAMKATAETSGIIYKDFDRSKRFSWTAGADMAVSYQSSAVYDRYLESADKWSTHKWNPSRATIYQLWAGLKYRCLMLWAGMREHTSPIVDDRLSSGDLILSNNARAIPQVEAGFIDFQDIPFTKGWVQITGAISYGKYTDSNALKQRFNYWNSHITTGQLFTYKRIHFRTRTDRPFSVTVGIQLGGEFGGTTYRYNEGKLTQVEKNGQSFNSFMQMIIPKLRSRDGFVEGNHIGTWDFKGRYKFKNGSELEGYFQWIWEDGSGMAKRNMTDGLWGLSFTFANENAPLKKVVAEYIDMSDQSGPIHWAPSDAPGTSIGTEATGGDNYYNNTTFNAWANYGLSLGSSFPVGPLYNTDGYPQFRHNRTRGFQLGALGNICPTVEWTAKFSYAAAGGTGRVPIARTLKNTSAMVSIGWDASKLLKGLRVNGSLGFDAGSLRGHSFGALLKVSYTGAFNL